MSRLRLIAIAALALVLALPATVSAAVVDVTGTVTAADGTTPVANVEVAILVQGSDEIFATTTDANGAWGLQLDLVPGNVLEVSATGATVRSEPDEDGCVTSITPTARLQATVGEAALEPVAITLDGEISGEVCAATATPEVTTATPRVTPPATDVRAGNTDGGNGALVIAAGLGLLSAALFAAATPRRSRRVAVRARR